jgi:O-succinylbenzoic acid--CoA ligase
MTWSDTIEGNRNFWRADTVFFAVNPRLPDDTDGILSFVVEREETSNLIYFQTSGSEGIPKWVGLSRAAFLASARAVNEHLESTSQDRWLITLPLHHVGGFSILARCHESGAKFFHMKERWSVDRFIAHCLQATVTLTSLVPTQVFDLVQANLHAPPGLRGVVVGGGALAKGIGLRAVELGWPVLQSYGMTEACSQIATEPLDHLYTGFDPDSLEVLGSWDLQTDEQGTLSVRGPALATGYLVKRDGAWSWERISAKRGLISRDRVQLWEHGTRKFLKFLGRESSFVKVLGELVNVAVLQQRLEELMAGEEAALGTAVIFPLADERKETRLLLAGTLSSDQLEMLRARFNENSPGHERIDESREIPKLPRTALGKLDMAALRTLLGEAAQRPGE